MDALITVGKEQEVQVNLDHPLDISLPLGPGNHAAAWYVNEVSIDPVRGDGFTGSVKEGGSVNFMDVAFNPHGNGTHTECVGHITPEHQSLNHHLKTFHFTALVVSVTPEVGEEGFVISDLSVFESLGTSSLPVKALVVRTLPNEKEKQHRNYSGTNPPYFDPEWIKKATEMGIDHLLTDLPSVDPETDGGKLLAHKTFWEYPKNTQLHRTITEMIYVDDTIADGLYLLNLQITSLENDASPSKPVLYKLEISK